jgi:hypothetical protein
MRAILTRLLVGFLLLLVIPACDFQSKYFRKLDLAKVNRWGSPYQGFNLEMNFAAINLGFHPGGGEFGAGFGAVDMNIFYSLALGAYISTQSPNYSGMEKSGISAMWTAAGGLIYQPVASWHLKPYIKVGGGGVLWRGNGMDRWSPIVEGSVGVATAFNYRMALDFYVARDMMPEPDQDPWIMGVRLNLVGFSLVSYKPEEPIRMPSDDMPGDF